MRNPDGLYELVEELPELGQPVLIQALSGFIDAGGGVRLAREHLLETGSPTTVARFDLDQLLDYRSRRPTMLFVEDHWESYEELSLSLHLLHDRAGTPYLLLTGPEPDLRWEGFTTAVIQLVERLGVRLTVGLGSIPMAVPHTRPTGVTAHATRPELILERQPWRHRVQVPASVGHLLEFRLGKQGHDALGFVAHVPHYLAQSDYPAAAETLLHWVSRATGLVLPTEELHRAADTLRVSVDAQVARSEEIMAHVRRLEEQYDAMIRATPSGEPLDLADLPTADELGAELERFLAEQAGQGDSPS